MTDLVNVESSLKNQQRLYTLNDYIRVMEGCRKKKKFVVAHMQADDFKGTNAINNLITTIKVDTEGNKINWLNVRTIKIERSKPCILQMKTNLSQPQYIEVNIKAKRKGRPSDSFQSARLIFLWPDGKPIRHYKKNDVNETEDEVSDTP